MPEGPAQPVEHGAAIVLASGLWAGAVNAGANVVGAVLVFVYLRFVLLPPPVADPGRLLVVNGLVFVALVPTTVVIGTLRNRQYLRRLACWLDSGAPPGPQQRAALAYPAYALRINVGLWAMATAVFGVLNAPASVGLARNIAVSIAYGGVASCTVAYLVSERRLRPLAAAALSGGLPERDVGPGVRARILMAWIVAAALPIAGMAVAVLLSPQHIPLRTSLSALFIGAAGLMVGLVAVLAAAGTVAEPVGALRRAVAAVGAGDLDTSVRVDDGSEIGRLQAGFNLMVGGLRERARLADLFGRQVGPEVAVRALAQGVELGGERLEVGVLFVDVIGSTTLAVSVPAEEVVRRLNAFFTVVVAVAAEHGGVVNKFEGDAALVIFGAPEPVADPAGCALAAGRALASRLDGDLPAAVGIAYGPVVAGNVGSEDRYEYTVIGDAVNEAARLTELAKRRPGRLLASGGAYESAAAAERTHWTPGGEHILRGRATPTALFVGAGQPAAPTVRPAPTSRR